MLFLGLLFCFASLDLKMKAIRSLKIHSTTQRHIPEDFNFEQHRCEMFKSRSFFLLPVSGITVSLFIYCRRRHHHHHHRFAAYSHRAQSIRLDWFQWRRHHSHLFDVTPLHHDTVSCYAAKVLGIQPVAAVSATKAKVTCGHCSRYLLTLVLQLATRGRHSRQTRFRRGKSNLCVCKKK
jgi:hypothetical protein